MRRIRASAPARVDLAGGTLDIWPLYLLIEGAVTVNAAISLRARAEARASGAGEHRLCAEDLGVSVRVGTLSDRGARVAAGGARLPLHECVLRYFAPTGGIEILTRGGVPAGSGLGGSSALAVCLLAAVARLERRDDLPPETLAAVARDLEAQVIEAPTGTQDHLAAIHGGVAAIHYAPGPPRREGIPVRAAELERRGVLAYLGASRASARANWDMVRRALDGDPATRRGLSAIAAISARVRAALLAGDLDAVGTLLAEEWDERRGLSPEVTTPGTEIALDAARRAGAAGGKICGAGGGGCLFVMGPPDARDGIAAALAATGCTLLDFRIDTAGLVVEEEDA